MAVTREIRSGWKRIKGHPNGGEPIIEGVRLTPMRAIRRKCLDCTAWQPVEVRLCASTLCALHAYRMGRTPTGDDVGEQE